MNNTSLYLHNKPNDRFEVDENKLEIRFYITRLNEC
jgi:hypothetical protein